MRRPQFVNLAIEGDCDNNLLQFHESVLVVGIDTEDLRHILADELTEKESEASWMAFLTGLMERGLHGIEYEASDRHERLKRAIEVVLTAALWQRCSV